MKLFGAQKIQMLGLKSAILAIFQNGVWDGCTLLYVSAALKNPWQESKNSVYYSL